MAQTRSNDSVTGGGDAGAGVNPDTTRTEVTADQLARGVSPVTDDASADAEQAVADEAAPTARNRRATDHGPSLEDRVTALEDDLRRLRGQLRHSL